MCSDDLDNRASLLMASMNEPVKAVSTNIAYIDQSTSTLLIPRLGETQLFGDIYGNKRHVHDVVLEGGKLEHIDSIETSSIRVNDLEYQGKMCTRFGVS